jgi:integrase
VQTFAGHSSLQVTMDRYGHLFKSDERMPASWMQFQGMSSQAKDPV